MRYILYHPGLGLFLGFRDGRMVWSQDPDQWVTLTGAEKAPTFLNHQERDNVANNNPGVPGVDALRGCELKEVFPMHGTDVDAQDVADAGLEPWGPNPPVPRPQTRGAVAREAAHTHAAPAPKAAEELLVQQAARSGGDEAMREFNRRAYAASMKAWDAKPAPPGAGLIVGKVVALLERAQALPGRRPAFRGEPNDPPWVWIDFPERGTVETLPDWHVRVSSGGGVTGVNVTVWAGARNLYDGWWSIDADGHADGWVDTRGWGLTPGTPVTVIVIDDGGQTDGQYVNVWFAAAQPDVNPDVNPAESAKP